MVTAYEQPALGGVYKLIAIENEKGQWQCKAKITEDVGKKMLPGVCNVRRYFTDGQFTQDIIYDPSLFKGNLAEQQYEELLTPVVRAGKLIYQSPSLPEIRNRTVAQLQWLSDDLKVLKPSKQYPVIVKGEF